MTENELVRDLDAVLSRIGLLKPPDEEMPNDERIAHALRCAVMYMDQYPEPDDALIHSYNKYAKQLSEEKSEEYEEFSTEICEQCGLLILDSSEECDICY